MLAKDEKVRPAHLAHLLLTNEPIIHYDCCQAGISSYHWGGEHRGFGYYTIAIGASCCLQANRYLFDERAADMSKLFYTKLLEEGKTAGVALLETRNEFAKKYPSPLYWAFPTLYGNPDTRLLEAPIGG
jgi:hypothetical protein